MYNGAEIFGFLQPVLSRCSEIAADDIICAEQCQGKGAASVIYALIFVNSRRCESQPAGFARNVADVLHGLCGIGLFVYSGGNLFSVNRSLREIKGLTASRYVGIGDIGGKQRSQPMILCGIVNGHPALQGFAVSVKPQYRCNRKYGFPV